MGSREYEEECGGVRGTRSPAPEAPPANLSDHNEKMWTIFLIVIVTMIQVSIWFTA